MNVEKAMWRAGALSISSGLLLTLGFPKVDFYPVTWVALLPLFLALQGRSPKQAFGLGFICGVTHYVTALYWIRYVVHYYGGLPLPVAISVLLLLCGYLALYPACFAVLAQRWETRPLLWLWGLPGAWVALEWIRAHALTGFPWANLGYTQTALVRLTQIADITGVYGVSWLLVLANTTVMACWRRHRPVLGVILLGGCLIGTTGYGCWRLQAVESLLDRVPAYDVAVVQGNIDQAQKWDPLYQQQTLDRYHKLSLDALHKQPAPDLIVWPETAAPFFYRLEQELTAQLDEMVAELGVPVLFGSPAVVWAGSESSLRNMAYLVTGKGELLGQYAKQHLVPFGEYVPYQSVLFFVHKLVQAAGNFGSGSDPSPLILNGEKLGVLICYEAIFPELARRTANGGATALVNITNDAWFGTSSAPYQHLEMARWRAIEFRLPLIRCANTGISAVVDAAGRVSGAIPLNEQGFLVTSVRPLGLRTFYSKWGDLFAWVCVLTTAACVLYSTRLSLLKLSVMRKKNRY